jgi:hypothetical protein
MKTLLNKLKPQYADFLNRQEDNKEKEFITIILKSEQFMMDLRYSRVLQLEVYFHVENVYELFLTKNI